MFKICIIALICINLSLGQRPEYLVEPSGDQGQDFSNNCSNPRVSGFTIRASCNDNSGNSRNAYINFSNCLKNIDGNLTRSRAAGSELSTRRCRANRNELTCQCQQPDGGFQRCSIKFDEFLSSSNGQLFCK